mgnify:FL=1
MLHVALAGVILASGIVAYNIFSDSRVKDKSIAEVDSKGVLSLDLPEETTYLQAGETTADGEEYRSLKEKERYGPSAINSSTIRQPGEKPADSIVIVESPVSQEHPGKSLEQANTNQQLQAERPASITQSNDYYQGAPLIQINEELLDKSPPKPENTESVIVKPVVNVPTVSRISPQPFLGSSGRQAINIHGQWFDPNASVRLTWGNGSKEFSARLTPDQWKYINQQQITLFITTGVEAQSWSVNVKNPDTVQSNTLTFNVIQPYIEKMAIKAITPSIMKGADKRRTLTVKGMGFNQTTSLEVRWDKNKKMFSRRKTPQQWQFVSDKEIKLTLNTGTTPRNWSITAISSTGKRSNTADFQVIETAAAKYQSEQGIHGPDWLAQQNNEDYTLQIFSSYDQQVIEQLVSQYKLYDSAAWYKTRREQGDLYSLTYGRYPTKQSALDAFRALPEELRRQKPWARSFASIKQQQSGSIKKTSATSASSPGRAKTTPAIEKSVTYQEDIAQTTQIKDEAWLWIQNPKDYTLQLLTVSNKQAVLDYINTYQLRDQAIYFAAVRDGKPMYVLVYGAYTSRVAAEQASADLQAKLSQSTPWIRTFADIHVLMTP